jgi:hypothetical protein
MHGRGLLSPTLGWPCIDNITNSIPRDPVLGEALARPPNPTTHDELESCMVGVEASIRNNLNENTHFVGQQMVSLPRDMSSALANAPLFRVYGLEDIYPGFHVIEIRIMQLFWMAFSPHPPGDEMGKLEWASLWPQHATHTVHFYVSKPKIRLHLEKGPMMSPPPGIQPPGLHSRKENVWVTSEPMFKLHYELEEFNVPKDGVLCISVSPTSQNQKQEDLSGEAVVRGIHGSVSATFSLFKQCVSDAPSPTGYLFISGYSLGKSYLTASIAGHESYHPIIGLSEEIMILFMPGYDQPVLDLLESSLLPDFSLSQSGGIVEIKRCLHGDFMYMLNDIFIGRSLHVLGEWSETEVGIFIELIAAHGKGVVLDIGANIGAFTVPLATATKLLYPESAKVLSFEPQKRLFNMLSANVALNDLGDVVEAFNSAVGSRLLTSSVSFRRKRGHKNVVLILIVFVIIMNIICCFHVLF